MGEEYQYDAMMADIERMEKEAAERAAADILAGAHTAQAAFSRMPVNGWQTGCPYIIGDVVFSVAWNKTGKVIGLPTKDDAEAQDDSRLSKAWVLFEDDTRAWIGWDDMAHVRRSPTREKRPTAATPNCTC